MSDLKQLPPWATTGIGSLPQPTIEAAAAHAVAAYDVPFCPQVPKHDGDMITQWLGSDPAGCGWSPARDATRPRAWSAFLDELGAREPAAGVVKLQVTGPVTLAAALLRESGEAPTAVRLGGLGRELAVWLAANTSEQVGELRDRELTVILLADEPELARHATVVSAQTWDPLRALPTTFGLHLCCAVPWNLVDRLDLGVLSFDLAVTPLDDRAVRGLRRQLADGRRVAWGAIAPHLDEAAPIASARLRHALTALELDHDLVAARSLLTPSCGSGRVAVAREQQLSAQLASVGRDLRRSRGSPKGDRPAHSFSNK